MITGQRRWTLRFVSAYRELPLPELPHGPRRRRCARCLQLCVASGVANGLPLRYLESVITQVSRDCAQLCLATAGGADYFFFFVTGDAATRCVLDLVLPLGVPRWLRRRHDPLVVLLLSAVGGCRWRTWCESSC